MERVEPRPGVDCEVGSVIQINHETAEGVIYLEDNNLQLPFHLSKIKHLDKRFLNDIVIGVQFYCKVSTDCKGVHKIQEMLVRDMMEFEGKIVEIHRYKGTAEIVSPKLATKVVFCRSHLDDPDDFQRIQLGDRVRFRIEFYNLIARRKPPRANKVWLIDDGAGPQTRLRPALRRSSSLSTRVGKPEPEPAPEPDNDCNCDSFDCFETRPRSSSHGSQSREERFSTSRSQHEPVADPFTFGNRRSTVMLPPFLMHGRGRFTLPFPPGMWAPPQVGMPRTYPVFPPLPHMGMPPTAHRNVHRQFASCRSWEELPIYRALGPQAASRARAEPERSPRGQASREEVLMNVFERPAGSLRRNQDDSDVVLEMTVEELRQLMLSDRRAPPRPWPRNY